MEVIINSVDFEFVKSFLSEAARSSLAEYLVVVAVVWHTMGRKVGGHFSRLESAVVEINATLKKGFEEMSHRIDAVEKKVNSHDKKIRILEGCDNEAGQGFN